MAAATIITADKNMIPAERSILSSFVALPAPECCDANPTDLASIAATKPSSSERISVKQDGCGNSV
jgi:hypothetical protein